MRQRFSKAFDTSLIVVIFKQKLIFRLQVRARTINCYQRSLFNLLAVFEVHLSRVAACDVGKHNADLFVSQISPGSDIPALIEPSWTEKPRDFTNPQPVELIDRAQHRQPSPCVLIAAEA